MRAGFSRLFKSKSYYITALITALLTFLTTLKEGMYWGSDGPNVIDFHTVDWLSYIPMSAVVVACFFCDSDYRAGAIRNKIVVGLTRIKIYLSNFVVCFVGAVICFLVGCAMIAVTAAVKHQIWLSSIPETIYLFLAALVIIACSVAIALFFAMLIQLPAIGSIITLLLLIFSMFVSVYAGEMLGEPEYRIIYGSDQEWVVEIIQQIEDYDKKVQVALEYGCAVPNPYYVGGVKRFVYGAVAYLLPGGQVDLLYDAVDGAITVDGKPGKPVMPVFPLAVSASFSAALTALGVVMFARKNIN